MHELLISLVVDWIHTNNTINNDLKTNGDKMMKLLQEA